MKSILFLFVFMLSVNLQASEVPKITSSLSYQELQKLKADTPVDDAYFGCSVAIDGDTAVVGAYGFNANTGRVYIYQYDETTKQFLQTATLTGSNLNSGDYFGKSVAISGDTVVVGAYKDDETNTDSGAAYIYEKPSSGWVDTATETAKLKASDSDRYDYFGRSVVISGDTVVVGAYGDDETNSGSGAAYIYEKPSSGWADIATETAKLKASDSDEEDNFGISVAISDNTVVVGAYHDDETNDYSGATYIYEKPSSGWVDTANETAKLKASDSDVGDSFGYSVAISGDTVVVGAYGDSETNSGSGAAYIYEKPISGWVDTNTETAKLKASDSDASDYFGWSVSISGDTVIVGAYGDDETNYDSGAAYIYKKPSSGWADTANETAKLKASDSDEEDYFGVSVAISGDTVVIGSPYDNETNTDSGAIYLFANSLTQNTLENKTNIMQIEASDADLDTFTFTLDGGDDEALFNLSSSGLLSFKSAKDYENPVDTNHDNIYEVGIKLTDQFNDSKRYSSFIKVSDLAYEGESLKALSLQDLQKLKADNPIDVAYFGYSVAIDGDTAVVGAPGFNSNTGRVYIYQYDETTKQFLQTAILTSSNLNSDDNFGYSVAISGDTVVVGAYGDSETNSGSGAAYIYEKPISGWANTDTETAKLKASNADANDYFGSSVAISGDTVVVGAYKDDDVNYDSGAAYIFEKPISGWVDTNTETAKLKASDADAYDYFGISLAVSGDTIIIGANYDDGDEINTNSGAAYIFEKPISGWINTSTETAKLKASDAHDSDYFGWSVAISGDTVIVGTYRDDDINNDSGAAYIYEKPTSGWVDSNTETAKLKASDADARDYFGQSVAISGDTVVVGAYWDDEINTDSGAVYIAKTRNIFNPAIIMYLLQ